ncbi:MAG: uracil-DNA glycosylase [Propionibacteriaceae bacterium]|jgi:uracil-DNA glycosylase|nr:uracil-DNA glycosylase [Propionibacteriaceae bacterium]
MAPDWAAALVDQTDQLHRMGDFLRAELRAGRSYSPAGSQVLRAFSKPLADVRVLILGQDPYPTPGHAVGLSFSVGPKVKPLPASLRNIYKELGDDLGVAPPPNGDLNPWFEQGVMLLNKVLTVQPGKAGSHRGQGWEAITTAAVEALAARGGPLVAILWGADAMAAAPTLKSVPLITSPHPSPLSAHRGFFGSKPFSRANQALLAQGATPIIWAPGAR